MIKYLIAYVVSAMTFFALDFAWLSTVASTFYKSELGTLLLPKPNLWPAMFFYFLYIAGVIVFCVTPALNNASWIKALLLGALFGLIAYATYDLSNLSTLQGWSLSISVLDMAWGSVATAIASVCGYFGAQIWVSKFA